LRVSRIAMNQNVLAHRLRLFLVPAVT